MTESDTAAIAARLGARLDSIDRMSDEREEWTKERFVAMEKSVTLAMSSADKAVTKAETATDKRFEGVNEFRATLADQAAMLLPRSEYSVQHTALMDRVAGLERRVGSIEDKSAGKSAGLTIGGQIILGVIALISATAASASAALHFFKA
jgi:hypothetical protein